MASIPALVSLWLVTCHLGEDPRGYAPRWSDEVFNWHQVATFRVAGFGGGYYTVNEEPSPLALSRFYTHGPAYPAFFGSLGRLIGWRIDSSPIVGAGLTSLALLFFMFWTKLDRAQLLLLGFVVLTFWPMHLYMATDMRLSFFDAMAIVFAAFFHRTITDPDRASPRFLVLFALLIGAATLSKLTWSFLFLPYLLHIRKRISLSVVQALGLAAVLILLAFGVHNLLAAPYPNFAGELLATIRSSLARGGALLFEHAWLGLRNFVDLDHHSLWLIARLQIVITLVWAGLLLARSSGEDRDAREGVLVLASSGLLLIMTVLLYDVFGWRDFRLFAPALLLATLLFIAQRRFIIVGVLLAGNLMVLPGFLGAYQTLFSSGRYSMDRAEVQAFVDEISPTVKFEEHPDGWQNTILAPLGVAANPLMLGIPPGVGISWFEFPPRLGRIKSRYLLLDSRSREALGRRNGLRYVKNTALGDLYINLDAGQGN